MGSEKPKNIVINYGFGDDAVLMADHMGLISDAVSGKMASEEYKEAMRQAEVVSKYNTAEPYIIIFGALIGTFCAFNNSFAITAAISESWALGGTVVFVTAFESLKFMANLFLKSSIKKFQKQCSATKAAINKMHSKVLLGLKKYNGHGLKDALPGEKPCPNGPFKDCGNVVEIKMYPEISKDFGEDEDVSIKKTTQYFSVLLGDRAGGVENWLRIGKTNIVPKNGPLRANVNGTTCDVDDVRSDTKTIILDSPPADFNVAPKKHSYIFVQPEAACAVVDDISVEMTTAILANSVGRGLKKVLRPNAPSSKKK